MIEKLTVGVKPDLLFVKQTADAVNELIDKIIVDVGAPDDDDGRPDGTIYFQID
jgi:hypothetical protein